MYFCVTVFLCIYTEYFMVFTDDFTKYQVKSFHPIILDLHFSFLYLMSVWDFYDVQTKVWFRYFVNNILSLTVLTK